MYHRHFRWSYNDPDYRLTFSGVTAKSFICRRNSGTFGAWSPSYDGSTVTGIRTSDVDLTPYLSRTVLHVRLSIRWSRNRTGRSRHRKG